MKILVIDDDKGEREHVAMAADMCGYDCEGAATGKEGSAKLLTGRYDIAIIDIELNGYDGKEILRQAHRRQLRTFLAVLSSHFTEADRLSGFAMGADDYLSKPMSLEELSMRLKAIARRILPTVGPEILAGKGIVVNVDTQQIRRNGRVIALSPREVKLLVLLMRNRGLPVSLETIVSHVWGRALDPDSTAVAANVSRLRKKLRQEGEEEAIFTVWEGGYVFK